jgi:hypothetical protein
LKIARERSQGFEVLFAGEAGFFRKKICNEKQSKEQKQCKSLQ